MIRGRNPTEGLLPPSKPSKHTVMGKFKDIDEAEAQCLKELKATADEVEIETIPMPSSVTAHCADRDQHLRLGHPIMDIARRGIGIGTPHRIVHQSERYHRVQLYLPAGRDQRSDMELHRHAGWDNRRRDHRHPVMAQPGLRVISTDADCVEQRRF
jgi:hypothetical protein